MRTVYKSSIALAASLMLLPAAFAQTGVQYQHEDYALSEDGKVGYNKYLVSNKPDANGEYTLRLETFLAGGVKATAIPTDFVVVLDASGSMMYDYRPNQLYPPMNSIDGAETWAKLEPYIMHEEGHQYTTFTVQYTYKTGTVGSTTTGSVRSATNLEATRSYYAHFYDEGYNGVASLIYHYESNDGNNGYYKIFRRMFDASDGKLLKAYTNANGNGSSDLSASGLKWFKYSGTTPTGTATQISKPSTIHYNLAIKLKDGTYKYLNGNDLSDNPFNATATNVVMFINNGNIYRLQRRGEALVDGVESFVNLVAAENAKNDQWANGIPARHQVSIVRFSGDYPSGGASITPPTGYTVASHVMFGFTEVGAPGKQTATSFIDSFEDKYIISGSTYTDYGMNLARMLLQDLQTKDGGKYAAVNSGGGVLRNKVVVFFTDGEPSNSAHGGGSSNTFFGTVTPTLRYGKTVKEVGVGKVNGRIYTIDLAMSSSTSTFLRHLSSNYPKGDATVTSGGYNENNFTGSKVPISESDNTFTEDEYNYLKNETEKYYKDSNDGDLASVFANIAGENVGGMAGEQLVVLDVMSDSFELPREISGKVKFYTAQCIGKKTVGGVEKLAFAKEIPADSRPTLQYLWVEREIDGTKKWVNICEQDYGYDDIDQSIQAIVPNNKKSITVKGFEFADLWCGLDESIDHMNNTRQLDEDDPNKDYALPGYRGFKLIIEFKIKVSDGALGGTGVPTNKEIESGLYHAGDDGMATGTPLINYQKPVLTIPVQLAIRKEGLSVNESASFTVQRRTMVDGSEWEDYTTFVLTCTATNNKPMIKLLNLNPDYYYRVKENGWSWAYSNRAQVEATFPTTEDPDLKNPIVIVNTPIDNPPKHAEAVKRNELKNY